MHAVLRAVVVGAALSGALALSGCSLTTSPAATPAQTAWTLEPVGPTTAPTTTGPALSRADSHASATRNRPVFDAAMRSLLKSKGDPDGPAAVGALAAAGFAKSSMQYSAATTSAHLTPGSILVSVQLGKECIVGQWGVQVNGYHSFIAPALGSGGCLVGGSNPDVARTGPGGQLGD